MAAFTQEQMQNFAMAKWYDLTGRVAIVTGGSTGLGLAITRCLVSAGAKVCVVSFEAPEQAADALAEFGDQAAFYQFDITDTDNAQALVDRIVQEQGRIDILINNAGNHCKKFIWDMTVEDYKRVLDVHLVGSFAMTKAVVPYMKEQKYGRIVFQASMTSYIGQPQVAGYSTAKAGFLGMIHTLTAELAEYGVTVNAIAPGWIDTPMFHKATDNDPPRLAKIMGRIPAKTVGDPMDVGMCAAFLCSDAARYISGSCIPVDGGALIGF
ncbi:SDR family NAD(P)-dependent oxidoreductase [uncultured Subdoligranulum sp.]|uniref:SDR family NAD(P)-dependent oxidoreductase n=1 Tax=uncultured Subdoligranulum sp. TaxID=512298 RepID=UPI0026078E2E|nr:SDR family NAD(P)-dependent oxidoreductase [uncultured Subdoligranulum sp.]